MLKVLFSIDCDFCHEPLETAAVCCDFEYLVWQSFAWDLTTYACGEGWEYDENRNMFRCPECVQQMEELQDIELQRFLKLQHG